MRAFFAVLMIVFTICVLWALFQPDPAPATTSAPTPTTSTATAPLNQAIVVTTTPEDEPRLKRKYEMNLISGLTLEMMFYLAYGELMELATVRQPDGAWVLFDPDNPAQRILQPELIAPITSGVAAMRAMDRGYRESVTQFTDTQGIVWERAAHAAH